MDNYRLCRICISQSGSPVMMSIFGEDALWKKITSFANVHIEEGDNLPQQICIVCAKNSLDAYSFKQKCEEADSFYRKQLLKRMELRLPDDTEIISISSGSGILCRPGIEMNGLTAPTPDTRRSIDPNNGNETLNVEKKSDNNKETPMIQNQTQSDQSDYDEDNFPTLIDANAGLSNGGDDTEWGGPMNDLEQQSSSSMDDKYDDSLPLIPEIELITPNDEDSPSHSFQNQSDVGEYQCTICFKLFAMKSILKNHIKTYHPDTNSMYQCFGCKKSYLSKRFLEKHIRMGRCVKKRKNTTRPMQCTECGTLFPTGHHLGWHKRTGNCRSRSPKLSLTEYEQKNDSDVNDGQENGDEFNNTTNSENQKRKKHGKFKQKSGRTRIKLDAKKIAYATELVKQQVSTTKFAQELKISRTFAWRLRKTLENNMYKEGKWNPVKPPLVKNSSTTGMKMSMPIIAAKNFRNLIPNDDVYRKDTININNLSHKFELNSNIDYKIQQQQQQQCDNSMSLCRSNIPLPYAHNQNNNKIDENQRIQPIDNIELNKKIQNSNMNLLNNNKEHKLSCEDNVEKSLKISEIKKEINITAPFASPIQQNDQLKKIEDNKNEEYEDSDTNDAENELQMNQKPIQNEYFQSNSNEFLNTMNTLNNYQRNEILKFNKNFQFNKNNAPYKRKPRKPNVFIDEEKYIQGKLLVSNNASTMDIAKILNISQMSAWKLRDCILKNIPITFKNSQPSDLSLTSLKTTTTTTPRPSSILPPFSSASPSTSSVMKTKKLSNRPKIKVPRLRLRRHERLQRDLIVTKEILEMIKEDRNIQYWKVSERLAEKGFPISPSSVCQRLKSMGIHRRLRPNDRNSIDNKNEQEHEHDNEQDKDQVKHQQNDSSVDDEGDIEDDDNVNGDISVNNNSGAIDLSDHSHFLSTHFNNLA